MIRVDSLIYKTEINVCIILFLSIKTNDNIAIKSYDGLRELLGEKLCAKILSHISHMFIGANQTSIEGKINGYQLYLYVDGNDFIIYSDYRYFVYSVNKYITNKDKLTNGLKRVIRCQGVYRDYSQDSSLLRLIHNGIVDDSASGCPHDTIMIYEKCVKIIRSNGDYLEYDTSGVKRLIIFEGKKK